jgi:hypothetical protein
MSRPTTQCRYLTRNGNQCTGEPADMGVEAEALLCTRHLGDVLELLKAKGFTITAPAAEWCEDCKHRGKGSR